MTSVFKYTNNAIEKLIPPQEHPTYAHVVKVVSRWDNFKFNRKKDIGKNFPTAKLRDFRDLKADGNWLNFRLTCVVLARGQLK